MMDIPQGIRGWDETFKNIMFKTKFVLEYLFRTKHSYCYMFIYILEFLFLEGYADGVTHYFMNPNLGMIKV